MTETYSSNHHSNLGTRLRKLSNALENGNIRQAHRLHSKFLKHVSSPFPAEIQIEFNSLSAQLRELEDWQHYATVPKRVELCEKMESLVDHNELHPKEKAKGIKELQDNWRALGPSDTKDVQQLWSRFKQAGDRAFVACGQYFDQKRQRRERNLAERNRICESLSLFYAENDWETTNWKAVPQLLRKARSEWKRFEEIPHAMRDESQHDLLQALWS